MVSYSKPGRWGRYNLNVCLALIYHVAHCRRNVKLLFRILQVVAEELLKLLLRLLHVIQGKAPQKELCF